MDYPTFEELNCAPDYLRIGANAMHNLRARGYLEKPATVRTMPDRREYDATQCANWRREGATSIYAGVSRRFTGYAATYKQGDRWVRGQVRQTEEEAARDYAAAKGRDYLEKR